MSTQLPAGAYPPRTKMSTLTYENNVIQAVVPVAGSVSGIIDLHDWTLFSIQSVPNGTILGGTVMNIWGAPTTAATFYPLYGTTGNVQSTIQMGSTTNGIYGPVSVIQPIRYIQLVLGGTQSAAQTFNLLVK